MLTNLTVKRINLLATYQCLALLSSIQHTKTNQPGAHWKNTTRISNKLSTYHQDLRKTPILSHKNQEASKKVMLPQAIIMPSTAKQAETTAYKAIRSTPITRAHGRPTQSNYETLKSDASALASKVEEITYAWSKSATDDYRLLGNILGVNEYN